MPEPALICEGLRYRYPGSERDALAGIDLVVEPGELVVLCGLLGIGQDHAAAGGVRPGAALPRRGGRRASCPSPASTCASHGPAELAAQVGLVAQEPESQVVSTTVGAEIELPLELRGVPPAQRARAVEEVALALAIADLLERTTDSLSGGELQRVALASALASRPSLLLLDEPTSQLDPVAGDELIGALRRLNEEWGVAILLGEHRLERCLAAADRVVAMDARRGRVRRRAHGLPRVGAALVACAGHPGCAAVRRARDAPRGERARGPAGAGGARHRADPAAGERGAPRRPAGARRAGALGRPPLAGAGGGGGADRRPPRPRPEGRSRRAGRPDGPQRRGQEHAAARGGRAAGADERANRRAPRASPCCRSARRTCSCASGSATSCRARTGMAALRLLGLEGFADADPRDLSGGERQRLALAIVVAGRGAGAGEPPGAVLLDEPTRGMDRARKDDLGALAAELSGAGAAVVVATHDVEFAAAFADRVVLMGRGEVVADGPARELLAGGWYFSTEVARLLSGAAATPAEGIEVLTRRAVPGSPA